uniref:Protein kish n=1 Tax=Leptobrachium leishanense TaxID=445787 RepID=A0A8C5WE30_9ANUR
MTNAYSLDGLLVIALLFVCTCAYFRKVPRLRTWLLSEKKGVWGVFYKGVKALLKFNCMLISVYISSVCVCV